MASESKSYNERPLLLALLEILVAAGFALSAFFLLADHGAEYQSSVSLIIASFGTIHGLHRIITVLSTKQSHTEISTDLKNIGDTLLEKIDDSDQTFLGRLEEVAQKVSLTELHNTFWQIDPELDGDRNAIMNDARNRLDELVTKRKSSLLTKSVYYNWITEHIVNVMEGGRLTAISRMQGPEWEDSPEERRFFEQNLSVAKRGGNVDRIFIMTQDSYDKVKRSKPNPNTDALDALKVFHAHSHAGQKRVEGWFVDESKLEAEDKELFDKIGDGFLMLQYSRSGERVVMVDDFTDDNEARGYVSKHPSEIGDLQAVFRQLQAFAEPLTLEVSEKDDE